MSIATEIARLQTAKTEIKAALEDKGATVPQEALLGAYAALVEGLNTGGLPSGVNGVKYGSFTMVNDANSYTVSHNFGQYPCGGICWTNGFNSSANVRANSVLMSGVMRMETYVQGTHYGCGFAQFISSPATDRQMSYSAIVSRDGSTSYAYYGGYGTNMIRFGSCYSSSVYFRAGKTYFYLIWY